MEYFGQNTINREEYNIIGHSMNEKGYSLWAKS